MSEPHTAMDRAEPGRGDSRYSTREEIAHSITHGIGVLLSVTGLAVLTAYTISIGNTLHIVSGIIFGSALVMLYTASTLYHSTRNPKAKSALRVFDHSSIYILIAASYTPFTLGVLQGTWGWSVFGAVWGVAALGIILQFTSLRRFSFIRLVLYLMMGWSIVIVIKPLAASVSSGVLALLSAGGLSYTAGIVFYLWKRLPYHHAIWHLFVLAGSILHYFAVFAALTTAGA